ncbi:MAG: TolC family protein, partial [Candidatus Kapaibacteriota bacterium]
MKIGILNNNELRISLLEIEKAENAVKEAKGRAFPSLDFTTSFYHYIQKPIFFFPDILALLNNSTYGILFKEGLLAQDQSKLLPMGLIKQSFVLQNQFESKLQFNQILFNSTVFRGIGASKIYLDLSKYRYKATLAKTITQIKKAFYTCLLLKNVSEIYEQSLKNAEENLQLISSLYNQGLVSEFELLQAEVQVENLKPIVVNSRNSYENSLKNLKLVINLPIEKEIEPLGELEFFDYDIPNLENSMSALIENNLDLKVLEYKRKIDIEMVELYRSEYYPSLVAFGNFSFAGQSDKLNFQTYTQSLVGVQLSINLFNGQQTKSRVQQSIINYKETEEQIDQLKSFLKKQLSEKYFEIEKTKKQILAQEKNIKLAEKAYQIAQTRYKEGTGIQLELKNSELELRQARINYQQAVFEYILAIIDIENILGVIQYEY